MMTKGSSKPQSRPLSLVVVSLMVAGVLPFTGCGEGAGTANALDVSDSLGGLDSADSQGDSGVAPETAADASPEDGSEGVDVDVDVDVDVIGPEVCTVAPSSDPAVVALDTGLVRGVDVGDARVFYRIPFAAPPVGELRFRSPQAGTCWDGEMAHLEFGPHCIQRNLDNDQIEGEEDCLTLNVWAPKATATSPRPVMVFIHGGGNIIGGAATTFLNLAPLFDGRRYAERHDTVLVTIQYRLGPFGFLNLPELTETDTNLGTRDQVAALQWVQRNIEAFGGDPQNVTVFGESAGAVNTCTLLGVPSAAGLFHRALMQSGGCPQTPIAEATVAMSDRVDGTLCGGVEDRVACLRGLSGPELAELLPGEVNALTAGVSPPDLAKNYGPVVDGAFLPQGVIDRITAGLHNDVPVVVGANNEELALTLGVQLPTAAAFEQAVNLTFAFLSKATRDQILATYDVSNYPSPTAALVALYSDLRFVCPARHLARTLAQHQTQPVWRYHFSRRAETNQGSVPASHGIELAFVFGTMSDVPAFVFTPAPADVALSDTMISMWAAFAATGDPNVAATPAWPLATSAATDSTMVLDVPLVASASGVRAAQCDLWDGIVGN